MCAFFLFSYVVDCLDLTCSNHGVCVNGECLCSPGWGGINCELPRAQCPDQCSGHGTYLSDTGLCSCDPNWMGPDCSVGKKSISCDFASVLLFWQNVNIRGKFEMQITYKIVLGTGLVLFWTVLERSMHTF